MDYLTDSVTLKFNGSDNSGDTIPITTHPSLTQTT